MAIYRLTPKDDLSDCWKASIRRCTVIVRAQSESQARLLASGRFGIATQRGPASTVLASPWGQSNLVGCELANDTGFPAEGPDGVLEPTESMG